MKALHAFTVLALIVLPGLALSAFAEREKTPLEDTYPLKTCPVTGGELGSMGEPVVVRYEGREVRFCCAGCPAAFEQDLEESLKKLDEEIAAELRPGYPLATCLVGGSELGKMGEPFDVVRDNKLVRLCCAGCLKTFEKGADRYLAKLDSAYAQQKALKKEGKGGADGDKHRESGP